MFNPLYLTLSRHNIFYFRYPLPPAFHPLGKASEIRLSLGTREPKEALQIARSLAYLGSVLTRNQAVQAMDFEDVRDLMIEHFKAEREKVKSRIGKLGPLQPHEVQAYINQEILITKAIEEKDYSLIGTDQQITNFMASYSMPVEVGSKDFKLARTEYLKASRDYQESILRLNKRYDGYDYSTDPSLLSVKKAAKKARRTKLKAVMAEYVAEKTRLREWREKSARGFQAQFDLLLEYLGEDASIHLSGDIANDVKMMLMQLPKQARSKPSLKRMTLQEILSLPADHPIKKDNLMEPANIRKYLSTYSSFFDWAVNHHKTDENNFKSINIQIDKNERKRYPFSLEQLRVIYDALLDEGKLHYKWGSLIAMFSGARLGEIAQMLLSDVKQEDSIWYLDINDEGTKKLKNKASIRKVPIHSKLIELGLLEYLAEAKKQGHDRVLYGLPYTRQNGFGRNLSRWFNGSLLVALEIKHAKLTYHSLRHWVITSLQRLDVEDSLVKRLVGHTQTDVQNLFYAEGQTMAQRQKAIEKLSLD